MKAKWLVAVALVSLVALAGFDLALALKCPCSVVLSL